MRDSGLLDASGSSRHNRQADLGLQLQDAQGAEEIGLGGMGAFLLRGGFPGS